MLGAYPDLQLYDKTYCEYDGIDGGERQHYALIHRVSSRQTRACHRSGLDGWRPRAAYQAGVLRAVVDILDAQAQSDFASHFDIICGTSAGAINAAAYACRADRPRLAVHRMCRLWATLNTSMIYRADAPDLIKTGVRWLSLLALGWMFSGLRNKR